MLLYGSYAILVNLSKVDGQLPYLTSSYVLCSELSKLVVSGVILQVQRINYPSADDGLVNSSLSENSRRLSTWTILSFAVPAMCYCVNNNLGVIVQKYMDPASFMVLGNFKIVTTTFLFRVVMKKTLRRNQWLAVLILTAGGGLHSMSALQATSVSMSEVHVSIIGLFLLGSSCLVSAFGSVFTEYLLKQDNKLSLVEQTGLLYTFGVVFNFMLWCFEVYRRPSSCFCLFEGYSAYTYLLVLTQVLCGLIMSLVMKYLNNMVKVFIVACAPLVTTMLAYVLFNFHIQAEFIASAAMVVGSVMLYSV